MDSLGVTIGGRRQVRTIYGIFELLRNEDYIPSDVFDLPANADDGSDPLPGMESNLRKIAQINRLRQSYLVLRDWMKRRPW
jgi:hypothetical protein